MVACLRRGDPSRDAARLPAPPGRPAAVRLEPSASLSSRHPFLLASVAVSLLASVRAAVIRRFADVAGACLAYNEAVSPGMQNADTRATGEKTMFQRILVPTDGSQAALHAVNAVAALAAPAGNDVHVTVVLAIAPINAERTDLDERIVARQNQNMRCHAQGVLESTAALFARRDIPHAIKALQDAEKAHKKARRHLEGGVVRRFLRWLF